MDIILNDPAIKGELTELIKNIDTSTDNDKNKDISLQQLSDLFWVAYGNNLKKENNNSTFEFLEIYAFMENGIYKYEPDDNQLNLIIEGDFRDKTRAQNFAKEAYLIICIFFNAKKYKEFLDEETENNQHSLTMVFGDCAYISGNIYLYCSLNKINTVARVMCGDNSELKKLLNLSDDYKHLLTQSIGY